ncbi:MAG: hypothetical protein AABX00_06140 [Nanoarchaeota archaeon]
MILKVKRSVWNLFEYILLVLLFSSFLFIGTVFTSPDAAALNVTNKSVLARVNVSNTEPTLYRVYVTSPTPPIDLTANNATNVICNGSATEINGFNDIKNVSATFYFEGINPNAADDNNTHYKNISCGLCSAVPGTGNQNATCSCQFPVQYYANAGRWQCNMTINDSGGLLSSENSSFVTVNEVLGIDVETPVLDFGNLSASQISRFVRQNVTNTGNIPINVSVRGYGSDDEDIGQNLSMICEAGVNITFGYMRYQPDNTTIFGDMQNITNQSRQVVNLTIGQRFKDSAVGNSTNSTYWKLQIPLGAAGVCNGTIIFRAVQAY